MSKYLAKNAERRGHRRSCSSYSGNDDTTPMHLIENIDMEAKLVVELAMKYVYNVMYRDIYERFKYSKVLKGAEEYLEKNVETEDDLV